MKQTREEKFEQHLIDVEHGVLKISVVNGVPEITYMVEENKRVLIEMINTNKIKMIAVGRK